MLFSLRRHFRAMLPLITLALMPLLFADADTLPITMMILRCRHMPSPWRYVIDAFRCIITLFAAAVGLRCDAVAAAII